MGCLLLEYRRAAGGYSFLHSGRPIPVSREQLVATFLHSGRPLPVSVEQLVATFLHSGRPIPVSGDTAVRNECVVIVLDEKATATWRQSGEVCGRQSI